MVAAVVGMACQPGPWVVFWAAVLGFSNTVTFVLALALPALLCPPEDVPRLSAGMFTISYHWAVAVTILGGVAWDVTGTPHVALALIGVSALAAAMIAPTAGLARAPADGLELGRGAK
jgi:CP family cyanate transporter-like MFS transporter